MTAGRIKNSGGPVDRVGRDIIDVKDRIPEIRDRPSESGLLEKPVSLEGLGITNGSLSAGISGGAGQVSLGGRLFGSVEGMKEGFPIGGSDGPSLLGRVQRWFVELYKRVEGDMSRFMLASEAFKFIPPKYRPGNIIEVTGIRIPKSEVSNIWCDEKLPEGVTAIVESGDDYIFWFHPLALSYPAKLTTELEIHHAEDGRTDKKAYEQISGLLARYLHVKGMAVVSSSVRTVLLFQVGDRHLDVPYELKLHLPRFIIGTHRGLTTANIEKVWRQQNSGEIPAVPIHFGSSIEGSYVFRPEYDGILPPKRETRIGYSFGNLIRDGGFKIEGDKVHFQIPFFALFGGVGGEGQKLLSALYENARKRRPDLTPHDFVVDQLIIPFISPVIAMMNQRGVVEGGFHYQNPVVQVSVPVRAVDEKDPFSWKDDPSLSINGVVTKEVSGYSLLTRHDMAEVDALITNLWRYFATEFNWAAAFPGFDRSAFRKRMYSFLEERAPSASAPEGIEQGLWNQYVGQYTNVLNGIKRPDIALANEVIQQPGGRRMGGFLSFVHGMMIFATAPAGLQVGSEQAFVPMFDKIAFLTFAGPEADVHRLVEHENVLYESARQRAAERCVTPVSDPASFLQEVLDEAYSDAEIERLKHATMNHAGLLETMSEEGLAWLADLLFNPQQGLFTTQLRRFKELAEKKKAKVDHEHIPHVTYWFIPIAERLLRACWSGEINTPEGRKVIEKDITKLAAGLKTYDRGALFRWLKERFWGKRAEDVRDI